MIPGAAVCGWISGAGIGGAIAVAGAVVAGVRGFRTFRGATRLFPAARRTGAAFLIVRAAVRFAAFLVTRLAACFDELFDAFPRRCVFVFARQIFFVFFAMGHVRSSSRR